MEDQEERQSGWLMVLKDEVIKFFAESPIPGFKYVVEGRDLLERGTWAVFIVIALCLSITWLNDAFEYWDKHPVETTIDQVGLPVHELPFPAITVCDTESLTMPRKNRWKLVEKLLNALELIDPDEELQKIYPGRSL